MQAHVVDTIHEPADLVAGDRVVASEKRLAKLPFRDPCHVPFDGGDPRREPARRLQSQWHEHRERRCGHRQHGPDRIKRAGDERSLGREDEHRLRPHALAADRAQPVALRTEGAAAYADGSGHRVTLNSLERLRGQCGEADPACRFFPDEKVAARQSVQRVEHGSRERHPRCSQGIGHLLLSYASCLSRPPRGKPGRKADVGQHRRQHEPHHRQHELLREGQVSGGCGHGLQL